MSSGGIYKFSRYARLSAGISTLVNLIRHSRVYRRYKHSPHIEQGRAKIHRYHIRIAGKRQDLYMRSFAGDIDIFAEIFDHEVYKLPVTQSGDINTIVDLGANIGLASLFFLDRFPHARLVAVEPDPGNFELLSKNLHSFLRDNKVQLVEGAVAATSGTFSLHQNPQGFNSRLQTSGNITVTTYSMHDLIQHAGFTSIDLLKVDIEGGEEQLFSGNMDFLHITRRIWMELHEGVNVKKIEDILASFHFDIKRSPANSGNTILLFAGKKDP